MHSTKIPQYNHDGRNANTGNSLKRYPCSHSYHHDGQYNFNFPEERGTPLSIQFTERNAQIMDNTMFVDKFTQSTSAQSKFVNKHNQFILPSCICSSCANRFNVQIFMNLHHIEINMIEVHKCKCLKLKKASRRLDLFLTSPWITAYDVFKI